MPLPRSALYAQGENLHVALWPGGIHNTRDITRFIALESRSYVASVSGLMRREDIGDFSAWRKTVAEASPDVLATGGSCIAGPDGEWLVAPSQGEEKLLTATIDLRRVFEERQNFDVSGQGTGGFESTPAFSAILIAKHPKFSRPVPTQPMETQQPRPQIINRLNRLFARYGRPRSADKYPRQPGYLLGQHSSLFTLPQTVATP
jgi:hypothetical protein